MTALNRDAILAAEDRPTLDVEVPEWGGTVTVRALSGHERDAFEASLSQTRPDGSVQPNLKNMRAKLVARAIVDDKGERLLSDGDIGALGNKSAAALNRVFDAIAGLSGMTAEAFAESQGNSDAAPSGASTSDSPETSD